MQEIHGVLNGFPPRTTSLKKYLTESHLYARTGLNLDDLGRRPLAEAVDYVTITATIVAEEARRAKKAETQANSGRRRR